MNAEYLTTEELRAVFKVTRNTLYNWRVRGLPSFKVGNSIRYDSNQVREWLENHKTGE